MVWSTLGHALGPGDSQAGGAIQRLLSNNRKWAQFKAIEDPDFFSRSAQGQMPEFLWIGCSDSRVVTNFITGLEPGDIFTHRNVGNIVAQCDLNCMSVVEYAVHSLRVKHVIVCGHYGCGACAAAVKMPMGAPGLVNSWISRIRDVRQDWLEDLTGLEECQQIQRLCELNAAHQTFNMSTSPPVQAAWAQGQELHVHGMIYDLSDGTLTSLVGPLSSAEDAANAQKLFVEGKGAAVSFEGNGVSQVREMAGR